MKSRTAAVKTPMLRTPNHGRARALIIMLVPRYRRLNAFNVSWLDAEFVSAAGAIGAITIKIFLTDYTAFLAAAIARTFAWFFSPIFGANTSANQSYDTDQKLR